MDSPLARTPVSSTVRRGDTYFIPDLIVVSEEVLAGDAVAFVPTEIHLTVEVLSPSGRSTDQVTKRYHYARMGVPQYWIVDDPLPIELDPAEFC